VAGPFNGVGQLVGQGMLSDFAWIDRNFGCPHPECGSKTMYRNTAMVRIDINTESASSESGT